MFMQHVADGCPTMSKGEGMVRSTAAVIAGLAMSVLVTALIEWAGQQVFPLPPGLDFSDPAQREFVMQQMPPAALGFVLAAWFFGATDGAMLAAWLAPARPWLHGLVVVGLSGLAAMSMLLLLPHPRWFVLLAPVLYLLAWLIGGKIGCMLHDRRRAGISR